MFKRVDTNINLAAVETEISDYWDKIQAFQTSLDNRKDQEIFRFYDGPPFPTGSPHYGNLLAGVIKRYCSKILDNARLLRRAKIWMGCSWSSY